MSKALNKKVESRKHAYALIFKLGFHDEIDIQKAFDYYIDEYIQEYVDENLSDIYKAVNFEDDVTELKTLDEYISKNINKQFIYEVFSGTYQNLDIIDSYIEKYAIGWKIDRISKGVLAVLRLAIYEIKFMDTIPNKVSVKESMDIATEYCGEDSVKFVNGILASVIKELEN